MKVISLQHATGEAKYIRNELPDVFSACFMENSDPVEIARFDTEEEARAELKKYKSTARVMETCTGKVWDCEAYALEFFEEDEDGEFLSGSDYDMAEVEITPDWEE